MPSDLGPREQVVWASMVDDLRYAGLLARVDSKALRQFCESWVAYQDANDALNATGPVLTEKTAAGMVRVKANPVVLVRAQLWKECYAMLRQFGLTPSARCGIKPGETGQRPDEQAKVASILKIAR